MTDKRKILWPTLLIGTLVFGAIGLAATGKLRSKTTAAKPAADQAPNRAAANRKGYMRRGQLSPKLIWHLKALGDRLEKPGKERLALSGELSFTGDAQASEVVATLEAPDRLRLTMQKGMQTRVVSFDGEQARAAGASVATAEQELIEAVVYDTAEHFFMTQMQGAATRLLGTRFRTDDGETANYSGPYYDIYQVADQIKISGTQREQTKLYYFNSDTLLLERVSYQMNRNGTDVKVEEVLSDWQQEQSQQIARRIERFENGKSVFVLTVRSAALSPRADDGIFTN